MTKHYPPRRQASVDAAERRIQKAAEAFPSKLELRHDGRIVLAPGAKYERASVKIDVVCTVCDHQWGTTPGSLLNGTGCPQCYKTSWTTGPLNVPVTDEEKQLARTLYAEGVRVAEIARRLSRRAKTVRLWVNPDAHAKAAVSRKQWEKANPDKKRAQKKRYNQSETGRATACRNAATYNQLKKEYTETLPNGESIVWLSTPMTEDEKVFRQRIKEECARLTKETGIPYEIDHIEPLSVGGEDSWFNLQLLPKAENRTKGSTYRESDREIFNQRMVAFLLQGAADPSDILCFT